LIRPVFVKFGGTVTRLAKDNLVRNPRRTGSNVVSLMVGLILVTIISTMNASFKSSITGWLDRAMKTDIIVSSFGKISTYQVQPILEDIGKELAQIPGVKPGSRVGAYGFRFLHVNYQGKKLVLKSFDEPPADEKYAVFDLHGGDHQVIGRQFFKSSEPTILISENMAQHFKKDIGDMIRIETPTGGHEFRVLGIVTDFASPEGVIYMSRDRYKEYWKDNLVTGFGLKILPGYDAEAVRKTIDQKFGPSRNLMTVLNGELRRSILQSVDDSFTYTRAIEVAALLVGLLGLLNTFLISILERTRELGLLRAVGMSRGQMQLMIMQEALTQGFLGALIAVALGAWIGYLWISTSLSHVLGWIIGFSFPWTAVAMTMAAGILVTLAAGLYPARRAAFTEIRDALEFE
jgi:putative ABC transport system permease protein